MRLCVTGGCGFIGGELIKSLNNLGFFEITIVDKPNLLKREDLIYKEILDYDNLDFSFLNNIDFVFHLGANSSTRATLEEVRKQNSDFSAKLIIECNLKNIYVVFASSGAIYGSDRRKNKNPNPLTHYGRSKLLTEQFVSFLPHHNVVCLRYHNVYGPSENHKGNMASIISKWINDYKSGIKEVILFKESEKILRDFVYVEDINEINILFLDYYLEKKKFPDNKIFDVGTGTAISFQKVADEIVKHTKQKIKYIKNPYNSLNYQFYTKAKMIQIKKIYREIYGKNFYFTKIESGVKKVFKKII